jgi:hypothetical protein
VTHRRGASGQSGEGEEEDLREEAYMVKIVAGSERLGQVCMGVCVSVCVCVCVCMCMCMCTYDVCMYVCMYIHTHVCVYVHTHTHTYTHRSGSQRGTWGRRRGRVPGKVKGLSPRVHAQATPRRIWLPSLTSAIWRYVYILFQKKKLTNHRSIRA